MSESYLLSFRHSLRISHKKFDGEITDLIAAARADLQLGGVSSSKTMNENDALIKRAIVSYVKAEFGLDNPDGIKYRESYDLLKRHLLLSDEYIKEA